jgi:hypothetical protein
LRQSSGHWLNDYDDISDDIGGIVATVGGVTQVAIDLRFLKHFLRGRCLLGR